MEVGIRVGVVRFLNWEELFKVVDWCYCLLGVLIVG